MAKHCKRKCPYFDELLYTYYTRLAVSILGQPQ